MITTPDDNNTKFTAEQTQAIEESKSRLLNLETEISIASKNLKAIKGESERAMKDKVYQEELLGKIQEQVKSSQTELEKLTTQKEEILNDLSIARSELSEVNASSDRKMGEISEQVKIIQGKETDLISREMSVSLREEDLERSEKNLQDKYIKIKDFVDEINHA